MIYVIALLAIILISTMRSDSLGWLLVVSLYSLFVMGSLYALFILYAFLMAL